jgi:hypothetical protein
VIMNLDYKILNTDGHNKVLEGVYHKGQAKIWDGKKILPELVELHGGLNLDKDKVQSIQNIFSTILWGEYAAWNVSAELAVSIDDFGAKMAATSQAHDEARHYYVLQDYFRMLGVEPKGLPPNIHKVLSSVSKTDNLAKKLIGMQLMIEPIAITIFKFVIKSKVEPVLCDLLKLYEIDEARHIALGAKYLPSLIKDMSYYEVADILFWQLRMMLLEIDGLKELEADFENLGFDINEVYYFAEAKQLEAIGLLNDQLSLKIKPWAAMRGLVRLKKRVVFDNASYTDLLRGLR